MKRQKKFFVRKWCQCTEPKPDGRNYTDGLRYCATCGNAIPFSGTPASELPSPEQRQADYNAAKVRFERDHRAWEDGGRQGPRPARPIPPHTPGWKIDE